MFYMWNIQRYLRYNFNGYINVLEIRAASSLTSHNVRHENLPAFIFLWLILSLRIFLSIAHERKVTKIKLSWKRYSTDYKNYHDSATQGSNRNHFIQATVIAICSAQGYFLNFIGSFIKFTQNLSRKTGNLRKNVCLFVVWFSIQQVWRNITCKYHANILYCSTVAKLFGKFSSLKATGAVQRNDAGKRK